MLRVKHIIAIFLLFTALLIGFSYIYLTKSIYWKVNKSDRENIVSTIKSAPILPTQFYEIYNKVYPNSLNSGQMYYLLNRENEHIECPCRQAAYGLLSAYSIDLITFTFWLEDMITSKECLNYYASQFDFHHGITGIYQASNVYFNKNIFDLNDYELLEIIIMMENPSLYNKKRKNGENLQKRVESIISDLNKSL